MAAWELISSKSLEEIEKMKSDLDRFWDVFLFGRPKKRVFEEGEGEEGRLFPLDVSETKDEIIINAELPGLDPQEINVSLNGNVLTIRGQKSEEEEKERISENYLFRERSYGVFSRSVDLPAEIQPKKVTASYRNGILKIVLPKSRRDKTRGIKIKTE